MYDGNARLMAAQAQDHGGMEQRPFARLDRRVGILGIGSIGLQHGEDVVLAAMNSDP